jgi:uncharacterized membrane protein
VQRTIGTWAVSILVAVACLSAVPTLAGGQSAPAAYRVTVLTDSRYMDPEVRGIADDGRVLLDAWDSDADAFVPLVAHPDGRIEVIAAGDGATAVDMNGQGAVVGWRVGTDPATGNPAAGSFVWDKGTLTWLAQPADAAGEALAINDTGLVVGSAWSPGNPGIAPDGGVVWRAGVPEVIDVLLLDVNDAGQAVGVADDRGPVLWEDGQVTDLGSLGGDSVLPMAIGDGGHVVGTATVQPGRRLANSPARAFVWRDGAMAALPSLDEAAPDLRETAEAVNASGVAVGTSSVGGLTAVVWVDGQVRDLNALVPADTGLVLTNASAINDAGQIAAVGTNGMLSYAVLLTPV